MRTIILALILGIVPLCMYPQSKLLGAGKGTKVGGNTLVPTKSETKKNTMSPAKKKTNRVRQKGNNKQNDREVEDGDSKYASRGFMEITGMNFANTDKDGNIIDDFGSDLYSSDVQYLMSQIYYKGLASTEKDIKLYIKIYKSNGVLSTGSSSPEGYSTSYSITVKPGSGHTQILTGWGTSDGGYYSSGTIRYELWYEGNMLFQKNCYINPGNNPLTSNKIIQINDITFGNEKSDNTIIDTYGSTLYLGKLQYVAPKISYKGLKSTTQSVKIYFKIISSNGTLVTGNSSPAGYSYSDNVSVEPGYHTWTPSGFGSTSGTTYSAGTYEFECWLEGTKLYSTSFTVVNKNNTSFLTVDSKTAVTASFSSSGGNETFYVNTDAGSWKTWGIPHWCEVTNKTAGSFTLKCNKNTTGNTRKDYMKIIAGDKEVRIDITQY